MTRIASQGALPLGPESTFLQSVNDLRLASSTDYGFWLGSFSVEEPQDGLLVIGGYDKNRIAEPKTFTTFTYEPESGGFLSVNVSDITYDTTNGSTSLLEDPGQELQMLLMTATPLTQLPPSMFDKFGNITGATRDAATDTLSWLAANVPDGNLTVTLNNGSEKYKFTIPPHELFRFERDYDDSGSAIVVNESHRFTIITPQVDVLPWFGATVFAMNYLVNHGNSTFELAPANTSTALELRYPQGVDLVPICNNTISADTKGSSSSISGGTIAGIVIGALAGVAVIVGGVIYILRRRKTQQSGASTGEFPSDKKLVHPDSKSEQMMPGGLAEVSGDATFPMVAVGGKPTYQEMPAESVPDSAISRPPTYFQAAELPAEVPAKPFV